MPATAPHSRVFSLTLKLSASSAFNFTGGSGSSSGSGGGSSHIRLAPCAGALPHANSLALCDDAAANHGLFAIPVIGTVTLTVNATSYPNSTLTWTGVSLAAFCCASRVVSMQQSIH